MEIYYHDLFLRFSQQIEMSAHITLYHKNDTNFRITCDLHNTCSILYRTYSAYKSPISRQHSNKFHSTEKPKSYLNRISVDSQQQKKIDLNVGHVFINNDDNNASSSADDELELILSDDDQETMFSINFRHHSVQLMMKKPWNR